MFQPQKKSGQTKIQFDENVTTQKINLDYVFVLSLIKLSDCSIDSFQDDYTKLRFIHAVKSSHNFGRIYWEYDTIYKSIVEELEHKFEREMNACEPEQRDLLTGINSKNVRLLDIAVSYAWQQFNALMGVATKLKPLDYQDEV